MIQKNVLLDLAKFDKDMMSTRLVEIKKHHWSDLDINDNIIITHPSHH